MTNPHQSGLKVESESGTIRNKFKKFESFGSLVSSLAALIVALVAIYQVWSNDNRIDALMKQMTGAITQLTADQDQFKSSIVLKSVFEQSGWEAMTTQVLWEEYKAISPSSKEEEFIRLLRYVISNGFVRQVGIRRTIDGIDDFEDGLAWSPSFQFDGG